MVVIWRYWLSIHFKNIFYFLISSYIIYKIFWIWAIIIWYIWILELFRNFFISLDFNIYFRLVFTKQRFHCIISIKIIFLFDLFSFMICNIFSVDFILESVSVFFCSDITIFSSRFYRICKLEIILVNCIWIFFNLFYWRIRFCFVDLILVSNVLNI